MYHQNHLIINNLFTNKEDYPIILSTNKEDYSKILFINKDYPKIDPIIKMIIPKFIQ